MTTKYEEWAFTFTWSVKSTLPPPNKRFDNLAERYVILDFPDKQSVITSASTIRIDLVVCADNPLLLSTTPREFLTTRALELTKTKSRVTVFGRDINDDVYPISKRFFVTCYVQFEHKAVYQGSLERVFTYNPSPKEAGPSYHVYANGEEYEASVGCNEISFGNFLAVVTQQWKESNSIEWSN